MAYITVMKTVIDDSSFELPHPPTRRPPLTGQGTWHAGNESHAQQDAAAAETTGDWHGQFSETPVTREVVQLSRQRT
jgi:hypothetical protein